MLTQRELCGLGLTDVSERGYVLESPNGDHYTDLLDQGIHECPSFISTGSCIPFKHFWILVAKRKITLDDIPVSLMRNCQNSSKDILVNPGNGGAVTTTSKLPIPVYDETSEQIGEFMENLSIPHKNKLQKAARKLFSQYTSVRKKIASFFYQHSQLGDEEVFRLTKKSGLISTEGIAHREKFLVKMNLAFIGSGTLAMPTQPPDDRLANKRKRNMLHD